MRNDTAALIERFAQGADDLAAALADLPAEALHTRPTGDEWSIAEVLAHLADSEVLAAERFRRIIADADATLYPLAQVDWATQLHYPRRDPQVASATFRALRIANTELLRLLPPDAWERTGRHLTLGPSTLREQVRTFADHAKEHIAQIVALRAP